VTQDHKEQVDRALLAYWVGREAASAAQRRRGKSDPGGRAGVTSGKHLDTVAQLLAQVCMGAGAPRSQVFYKTSTSDPNYRTKMGTGYTLPGFYRPTKEWDLVVYFENEPIIVLELKSQNGPSYGNNANNRAEEALGNSIDLAKACAAGLLPRTPWRGYVYVIEDDVISRLDDRGQTESSRLKRDPAFNRWSYIGRVDHLCTRMVESGFYDGTWAIATSRPTCKTKSSDLKVLREHCAQYAIDKKTVPAVHRHEFGWWEPNPQQTGYLQFIASLTEEIGRYYPASAMQDPRQQGELDLEL
jgi:restriction endonuclease XhoI-like protein